MIETGASGRRSLAYGRLRTIQLSADRDEQLILPRLLRRSPRHQPHPCPRGTWPSRAAQDPRSCACLLFSRSFPQIWLSNVFRPPQDIFARVGLRKNANLNSTDGEPFDGGSTSAASGPTAHAKVTDYLVGTQLDEALAAGQEVDIYWPFESGRVTDWTQAEALW